MDIFVIEDDLQFRSYFMDLLHTIHDPFLFPKWNIQAVTRIFSIEELEIKDDTLFFLDIDLKSSITGIDIGMEIRKRNSKCYIIYLTSFANFGRNMINANIYPAAYLLKTPNKDILASELLASLTSIQRDIQTKQKK
ncbi:response regulator [Listeria floridensis FSL S10-1187]|uniref:Response regulator n=1 Tax=Listeria floridensis FSL S10-1187 TaxID=1265817 RepID=A0ABP3AYP5_9LIST|nr:hypothetical protein [Listeria floridensis]EUJ31336.1 response regulator [Listeria floridensis FSL S10-1187]